MIVGSGADLTVMLVAILLAAIWLLSIVMLWMWGLVDLRRFDDDAWTATGQRKVLWVGVVLALPCIGTVLYILAARPRLLAVGR